MVRRYAGGVSLAALMIVGISTGVQAASLNEVVQHAITTNPDILRSDPSLSLLKVYVRHDQHSEIVKETIQEYVDHQIPTLYLSGEMCRRNLLVEIEALYTIQYS